MERNLVNDKVNTDFELEYHKYNGEYTLTIKVVDSKEFTKLTKEVYTIVPDLEDMDDVETSTIGIALAKLDGRIQAAREMCETPNTNNQ